MADAAAGAGQAARSAQRPSSAPARRFFPTSKQAPQMLAACRSPSRGDSLAMVRAGTMRPVGNAGTDRTRRQRAAQGPACRTVARRPQRGGRPRAAGDARHFWRGHRIAGQPRLHLTGHRQQAARGRSACRPRRPVRQEGGGLLRFGQHQAAGATPRKRWRPRRATARGHRSATGSAFRPKALRSRRGRPARAEPKPRRPWPRQSGRRPAAASRCARDAQRRRRRQRGTESADGTHRGHRGSKTPASPHQRGADQPACETKSGLHQSGRTGPILAHAGPWRCGLDARWRRVGWQRRRMRGLLHHCPGAECGRFALP